MKKLKLPFKIVLGVLALLLVVIMGYVIYVFAAWYRVEDNQVLDVVSMNGAEQGQFVPGEIYRIASYNIGFGAYSNDYSFFMDGGKESRARSAQAVNENVSGAMETVSVIEPQFLLLQEVDTDGTRSWHVNELQLVDSKAYEMFTNRTFAQNYDSPYLFWPLNAPHGANQAGIVTCSAFPIASAVRRQLPIEGGFMKLVDLDRCYSVQHIPLSEGGKELVLYNFHLSAYTSDGSIAEEQLKMLFADMQAEYEKGNYTIAGGDFNKDLLGQSDKIFGVSGPAYTWAQPVPASLVPDVLTVVAPFDEENPVASCRNADRPYGPDNYRVTVDGFVVSDNVEVRRAKVWETGFRWSDHNPVYMDFVLQ